MFRHVRIGTRGSKLALKQAEIVGNLLKKKFSDLSLETVVIKTEGDKNQTDPLSVIGGKGIFIRELETALLENRIDIAVHSLKDVTTRLLSGCGLAGFLQAESIADVMVASSSVKSLDDIPKKSKIGTGSLRRKIQIQSLRPDLEFVEIRGNVETRIRKVRDGIVDAVVLSDAGLIRLNLEHEISFKFNPQEIYPAPGQGVITLEIRSEDKGAKQLCDELNNSVQEKISRAEMNLIACTGFSCNAPLGIYTELHNEQFKMNIFMSDENGELIQKKQFRFSVSDADNKILEIAGMMIRK